MNSQGKEVGSEVVRGDAEKQKHSGPKTHAASGPYTNSCGSKTHAATQWLSSKTHTLHVRTLTAVAPRLMPQRKIKILKQDREVPGSIPSDATRRHKSVQAMESQPGNWAEQRAVTWRLRILDKGRLGLKGPHEPGD